MTESLITIESEIGPFEGSGHYVRASASCGEEVLATFELDLREFDWGQRFLRRDSVGSILGTILVGDEIYSAEIFYPEPRPTRTIVIHQMIVRDQAASIWFELRTKQFERFAPGDILIQRDGQEFLNHRLIKIGAAKISTFGRKNQSQFATLIGRDHPEYLPLAISAMVGRGFLYPGQFI